MVASDEGDEIWVPDFIGEEKEEGLYAVKTSVHKIAKEEIADWGYISSIFEELEQIIELPVDISAYRYRWINSLHVAFFD